MKEGMDLLVATETFLRSVQCEISLNTRLALNVGVLKKTKSSPYTVLTRSWSDAKKKIKKKYSLSLGAFKILQCT